MEFRAGRGAVWILRIPMITASTVLTGTLLCIRHDQAWWLYGSGLIFDLALLLAGWWYAPRLSRSVHGRLDASGVRIFYGVLWQRETVVPLDALRTYEVWAPPLHRLFHCRTVILRFAGGSAWLPLLACRDSEVLTRRLKCVERER